MTGRALALAPMILVAGCAGYQLAGRGGAASVIPPGVRTIGVPQFGNRTNQPQLNQRIAEALIDELVRRGRYQALPDAEGADIALLGTIESFRTEPVSFSPGGRYERVEVTITARIRLVQRSPEKVVWEHNHFVFRSQYDLPDLPGSQTAVEDQLRIVDLQIVAIEEIAAGFARSVVTSLLEGF